MAKLYLLLLLYLNLADGLIAQVINVVDQNSLQPVPGASIENTGATFSLVTDYRGQANIPDSLLQDGQLSIRHPSFETYFINHELLVESGYTVRLKEKIIVIDEVVVSANRWEQEKKETPNRILSVSPKEVALNNPQTTADMLGSTGQVFIQKSQLGGGSPMIRGFAASSVLIVVDGVRMNNAIFRTGNLQNVISIDPLTLENTEVLFGPGSVMYGSDALGGVMHFRTRSPGFINQGSPVIQASSMLRYSSANHERTGHADLEIKGKKISLYSSITYSDYDHLEMGNKRTSKFPDYGKRFQYVDGVDNMDTVIENPDFNEQIFSGYHQWNFLNKIRYRLGSNSDLSYTFNYSTTSDIPRYDRLLETDSQGNFKSAEWYYGPQKWLSNSLQLNLYGSNSFYDQARLTMALQQLKESRNDRDFGSSWLRSRSEKVGILTVNIDLEKQLNAQNTLFYGIEWFHNQVDSRAMSDNIHTGESLQIEPRYPDGGSRYSGLAAYLSHKWRPGPKIAMTTGIRYNGIWLTSIYLDPISNEPPANKFRVNNGALNGSLGVAWLPVDSWQLNALVSTGFRAPNVDDIGKIFDGANGVVTVPNTGLKPEYSYNAEVGFVKSIPDKFRVSATGFYSLLDNAMVQDDFTFHGMDSIYFDGEFSKTQALVNNAKAKIYGGSLQMELALTPDLGLNSALTISQGEDSDDRPLRHTTPIFGYLGLEYQKKQFRGEVNFKFSGKREFNDLPPSEQQKAHLYTSDGSLAWQTLNFSGSYNLNKSFTMTIGLENILNLHYRPYSSGISAAGRNFIVAVKGSL